MKPILFTATLTLLLAACDNTPPPPPDLSPKKPKPQAKPAPQPGAPKAEGKYNTGNPITAPLDYIGATGQAGNRAKYKIQILNAKAAIRNFHAFNGRYPANVQEIEGLPQLPGGVAWHYDPKTGKIEIHNR